MHWYVDEDATFDWYDAVSGRPTMTGTKADIAAAGRIDRGELVEVDGVYVPAEES